MLKRNFIDKSCTLGENITNVKKNHSEICKDDVEGGCLLEECYQNASKHPRSTIEKLFSEKATSRIEELFARATESCTLYNFKETYHKIGKYGAKAFTTALTNGIIMK